MVDDKELLELVEMEVRELLGVYKFPGVDSPICIGSAVKALEGDMSEIGVPAGVKLVAVLDRFIPVPKRVVGKPFVMPVDDVFSISWPRHGGDRSYRARHCEGERRSGDHRA